MIKGFCNLIRWVFILACNLKFSTLNWGVTISASLEINQSFILNYFYSGHLPIPKVAPGIKGKSWSPQTKSFRCYISWVTTSMQKKSKTLIDSFQRFWWWRNRAIWLDESILASNCQPEFSRIWGLNRKLQHHYNFCCTPVLAKCNNAILQKAPLCVIFKNFWLFLPKSVFPLKIRLHNVNHNMRHYRHTEFHK